VRQLVLLIALLFIGLLIYLTAADFKREGVTATGVIAVCVIVLFAVGIVGALLRPPRE
jgi:hypothetical protein